jgi:hypothetical protein
MGQKPHIKERGEVIQRSQKRGKKAETIEVYKQRSRKKLNRHFIPASMEVHYSLLQLLKLL